MNKCSKRNQKNQKNSEKTVKKHGKPWKTRRKQRRTLPQFDVSISKIDICKMDFEKYIKS